MGKYQVYEEYKNAGVDWLDDIPSHWSTPSLKMLIDVRDGTHETPSYVLQSENSYPLVTSKDVTSGWLSFEQCKHISKDDYLSIIQRSKVEAGDILMPMIGTVGSPIVVKGSDEFAIKNLALYKTSNNSNVNTSFLNYFLQSYECDIQFKLEARGGVQNFVSLGTLRDLGFPKAPDKEQQKIANFLDHETAKIDTLIEKQQQLIALLKEKRQAVISHAVTKGLNANAPMRDSGVEWLGEVPEHWEVTRLKYHINVFEQGWSPQCDSRPADNDEYGVLKVGCVNYGGFNKEENKALPKELKPQLQYLLVKGDLLISRANTKELVGSAAVVDGDYDNLILCDKLYRLRFDRIINTQLIAYYLALPVVRQQIELGATGASHSMQNIGQSTIKEMPVVIPPVDEADELVKLINKKVEVFDLTLGKAGEQIVLLQERRTALISAAVTGKIDVRHFNIKDGSSA